MAKRAPSVPIQSSNAKRAATLSAAEVDAEVERIKAEVLAGILDDDDDETEDDDVARDVAALVEMVTSDVQSGKWDESWTDDDGANIKFTDEQLCVMRELERRLACIRSGQGVDPLIISGVAGAGKSTVLRWFHNLVNKDTAVLDPKYTRPDSTLFPPYGEFMDSRGSVSIGPTWTAATQIDENGKTIYNFLGVGIGFLDDNSAEKEEGEDGKKKRRGNSIFYHAKRRRAALCVLVVIVDEAFHTDGRMIDGIMTMLRIAASEYAERYGKPCFPLVIFCGDPVQLPPVSKRGEKPAVNPMNSDVFKMIVAKKDVYYLSQPVRQKDADLSKLNKEMRTGTISDESRKIIRSLQQKPIPKPNDAFWLKAMAIFGTRERVKKHNSQCIETLEMLTRLSNRASGRYPKGADVPSKRVLRYKMTIKAKGGKKAATDALESEDVERFGDEQAICIGMRVRVFKSVNNQVRPGKLFYVVGFHTDKNGTFPVVRSVNYVTDEEKERIFNTDVNLPRHAKDIVIPCVDYKNETGDKESYVAINRMPLEQYNAVTAHLSEGSTIPEGTPVVIFLDDMQWEKVCQYVAITRPELLEQIRLDGVFTYTGPGEEILFTLATFEEIMVQHMRAYYENKVK